MKKNTLKSSETKVTFNKKSSNKIAWYLFFLAFLIFANTIANDYNLDDELVTKNHPLTSQGFAGIKAIFTSPYYSDAMGYSYGYRPIVHLTFAIEHDLFGENPAISHFINVLLFSFSVFYFFKLLVKWLGDEKVIAAILVSLIFLVHPIHTEAVASIKNRDEILAFLFVIITALQLHNYISKKKWISLLWIILFFTIAMLSKKSVFPLVFIFPLVCIYHYQLNWKNVILLSLLSIVPGSVIASDFSLKFAFLLMGLPLLFIGFNFLIFYSIIETDKQKKQLFIAIILMLFSAFFLLYYLVSGLDFLIPLILIPPIITWYFNKAIAVNATVFILVFLGLKTASFDFIKMSLILSVIYSFYKYFKCNSLIWIYLPIVPFVLFFFFISNYVLLLLPIFAILISYYFGSKNKWLLVSFLLCSEFFIVLKDILEILPTVLVFAGLFLIAIKAKNLGFKLLPWVFFILLLILPTQRNLFNSSTKLFNRIPKENVSKVTADNPNSIKEGRELNFVENTLVTSHSMNQTFATGVYTLGKYTELMIFPIEFSYYYGYAKIMTYDLSNIRVVFYLLLLIGIGFYAIYMISKDIFVSIGVLWFFFSIGLFSNWIELVAGMLGERLLFTASAGFSVALGLTIYRFVPEFSIKKPKLKEGIILSLLLAGTIVSMNRNSQWKNALTLMEHDIKHLSNSAQANNLLATNYYHEVLSNPDLQTQEKQNYLLNATTYFQKSLEIYPEFSNAAYDLGRVSLALGNDSLAIVSYESFIKNNQRILFDPYYRLCDLYFKYNRLDDYLRIAKIIFKLDYKNKEVYHVLTRGYFLKKEYKNALKVINKARIKYPNDPQFVENQKIVLDNLAVD
jgi:tetratricopeptide (TPR) repeat protein